MQTPCVTHLRWVLKNGCIFYSSSGHPEQVYTDSWLQVKVIGII